MTRVATTFRIKTVREKLALLARQFGFAITDDVLALHQELNDYRGEVASAADAYGVPAAVVCPRFNLAALYHGMETLASPGARCDLVLHLVTKASAPPPYFAYFGPRQEKLPKTLCLRRLEERYVNSLMTSYHYLGYGRSGSEHIGMFEDESPAARLLGIATISPWDLPHLERGLSSEMDVTQFAVLSRLLCFGYSPRNTVTKMISKVVKWLRRNRPDVAALVTYCNPNSGHYGTTYRGSGFLPLCTERHGTLVYEDGVYISPRQFEKRLKDVSPSDWNRTFSGNILPILPLLLYILPMHPSLKRQISTSHTPFSAELNYPMWCPSDHVGSCGSRQIPAPCG